MVTIAQLNNLLVTGTSRFVGNVGGDIVLKSNGQLQRTSVSQSWVKGRDNAIIRSTTNDGYSPLASIKTANGSWEVGPWNTGDAVNKLYFSYVTDANYNSNTNTTTAQIQFLPNGHIVASLDGNASTASSANLATASNYPRFVQSNEIRFDINTKPQSAVDLYIGHRWSDGTADAKINGYRFENGNGALTNVYASSFHGTATNVTVNALGRDAWHDVVAHNGTALQGNSNIQVQDHSDQTGTRATYLKLGNGTATGTSGNKRGILRLYSPNAYFVDFFIDGTHLTANRNYMLPKINANTLIVGTTGAKGGAAVPVYVDANGELQQCKQNVSGSWHNSGVAYQSGSVLEIGRYIDFHCTAASTNDYDVRIDSGASRNSLVVNYPVAASTGAIIRNIQISTNDLTAGSSALTNGNVYLVFQ